MIGRRTLLASGAALAIAPWRAGAALPDLRAALDAARAERDPAAALRLLASFTPAPLAPSARLDLLTARAGFAIDVEIARRFGVDPRAKGAGPRDPAYLALLLRRKLGGTGDLRAITTRLEQERQLCETRATALFNRIRINGATTGARFTRLWQDERYPDSDAGRDAAVTEMNAWLGRFRAQVPAVIGAVPSYCLDVRASRPTSADLAAGHLGFRTLPTTGQPGGYIVDLTHVADRPRWTLPSVAAHELLPGHMLQLPLEAAADPHPLRLEYAPAFPEGWGIHAERLIAASGAYAADPRAELGYLHWRLFRIGRALVDLALHVDAISPETARSRLVAWQGEPVAFAPFDADLARIAQDPMTRVAEMLAALAIEDGARGRAGARLRRYHQAALANGRMRTDDLARLSRSLA
ncbi:DUF885 family protein [Sphingomonas sp. RB3P16]|uniref:DUF885 family protein n=1 Tax=Parasphingomonas frigoris TaxID=3096163 RepID=UPI002FC962AA